MRLTIFAEVIEMVLKYELHNLYNIARSDQS